MSIEIRDNGLIVENKNDNSPVSNADTAISNFIYNKLTELDKAIPVICEEQSQRKIDSEQTMWLVDPIDGTRNYIKNGDNFTVNIALVERQKPLIGLICAPVFRKLYFTDHLGKLCIEQDGMPIKLKKNKGDFVAVVSSHHFNAHTKKFITDNDFSKIIAIPSSIKLCMIAEGSGDIYPKFGTTMEWDIAAGHALINSSGGLLIDQTTGRSLSYGKDGFRNSDFLAMSKRYVDYNVNLV